MDEILGEPEPQDEQGVIEVEKSNKVVLKP